MDKSNQSPLKENRPLKLSEQAVCSFLGIVIHKRGRLLQDFQKLKQRTIKMSSRLNKINQLENQRSQLCQQLNQANFQLSAAEESKAYLSQQLISCQVQQTLALIVSRVQEEQLVQLQRRISQIAKQKENQISRCKALQEKVKAHQTRKRQVLSQTKQSMSSQESSSFSSSIYNDFQEEDDQKKKNYSFQKQIKMLMALRNFNHRRIRTWQQNFREAQGRPSNQSDRTCIQDYNTLHDSLKSAIEIINRLKLTQDGKNPVSYRSSRPSQAKIGLNMDEKEQSQQKLNRLQSEIRQITSAWRKGEDKLKQAQQTIARLEAELKSLRVSRTHQDTFGFLKQEELKLENQQLKEERLELIKMLSTQQNLSRRLKQELSETSGFVRLSLKVKAQDGPSFFRKLNSFTISVGSTAYQFDSCYDQADSQKDLIQDYKGLIDGQAKSIVLFAIGAEASGKSYTLIGDGLQPGLFTHLIRTLNSQGPYRLNLTAISYSQRGVFDLISNQARKQARQDQTVSSCCGILNISNKLMQINQGLGQDSIFYELTVQNLKLRRKIQSIKVFDINSCHLQLLFDCQSKSKNSSLSKLKRLFESCLNAANKLAGFITVSPLEQNLNQTISTLKYVEKLKRLRKRKQNNQSYFDHS